MGRSRGLKLLAWITALIVLAVAGRATAVSFELQLANPSTSIFRLKNTSPSPAATITAMSATVGDPAWNFDLVTSAGAMSDHSDPLLWNLVVGDTVQGGVRTDEVAFEFTGFEPGDRFTFAADLDPDSVDGPSDFRQIYFNNGPADNAMVSVDFLLGDVVGVLDFVLPDMDLSQNPQVLQWDVQGFLIPEPSTAALLLVGLGLMGVRGCRS